MYICVYVRARALILLIYEMSIVFVCQRDSLKVKVKVNIILLGKELNLLLHQ